MSIILKTYGVIVPEEVTCTRTRTTKSIPDPKNPNASPLWQSSNADRTQLRAPPSRYLTSSCITFSRVSTVRLHANRVSVVRVVCTAATGFEPTAFWRSAGRH
eukprot:scaffold99882_cov50-Prasinocladus_malaysianus.AAC.1